MQLGRLAGNRPMRVLAKELGFRERYDADAEVIEGPARPPARLTPTPRGIDPRVSP